MKLLMLFVVANLFWQTPILANPARRDLKQEIASNLAFYLKKMESTPKPDVATETSDYQLFDTIAASLKIALPSLSAHNEVLFSLESKGAINVGKLPSKFESPRENSIPLLGLWSLHSLVEISFVKLGLGRNLARRLGFITQKEVIIALGCSWEEYQSFLVRNRMALLKEVQLLDSALLSLEKDLLTRVEIQRSFNIPYLAGYTVDSALKVYLDRGLRSSYEAPNKEFISITDPLIVHEVAEKALMLNVGPIKKKYVRTHQIAQRIERQLVMAHGWDWNWYQNKIMEVEIDRAYNAVPTKVPSDLDYNPYEEYEETDLISRMKSASQQVHWAKPPTLFEFQYPEPGVVHLKFHSTETMAKTMLRFQEYFESPEFKGKFFSLEEFKSWYMAKSGKSTFTYYNDWAYGFNIPSTVFHPFFKGNFPDLSKDEEAILDFFKHHGHTIFYVIVTSAETESTTLRHEVAHARFFLNSEYKTAIRKLLENYNLEPVKEFLRKNEGGDYDESVLEDEVHAWLMSDSSDLKKDGFDIEPYRQLIQELNAVFTQFTE